MVGGKVTMGSTLRRTATSGLLAAGLLTATPQFATAHPAPPTSVSAPALTSTAGTAAGNDAGGLRAATASPTPRQRPVLRRWWGTEILLAARTVRSLGRVIAMGAGTAGVVSVLAAAGVISSPAAIPGGVAAAVLTLGRAALSLCNWNNRGVRILVPRMAPVATCLPR